MHCTYISGSRCAWWPKTANRHTYTHTHIHTHTRRTTTVTLAALMHAEGELYIAVRELAIPKHCYVPFLNLYLVIADAPLSNSIGCNCCIVENVTAMEHFCNCHSISADVDTILMLSLTNITAYLHMVNSFFNSSVVLLYWQYSL